MRYSGSKSRIASDILGIVTNGLSGDMLYIEPFVGGCNTFGLVNHPYKVGIDNNPYLIDMWKMFQCGYLPPIDVSRDDYEFLRGIARRNEFDSNYSWLVGYVLNSCSYGSAWCNGYASYNANRGENHVLEAYNNLVNQLKLFHYFSDSSFIYGSYEDCEGIIDNNDNRDCIIYCDPPYQNTKGYMVDSFNHDVFWSWVRKMSIRDNCKVYVSEYTAPNDFECIWEKSRKDGMSMSRCGDKQSTKIERLFVYSGN